MPSDLIGEFAHMWDSEMEDTFTWAYGLLRRFRYKPGWVFEMTRNEAGPTLRMQVMVPDSRHPNRPPSYREMTIVAGEPFRIERDDLIPVSAEFTMPIALWASRDEDVFWKWLRERVLYVESHEADEWFRVDNVLPFDPHAPRHVMPLRSRAARS